MKEKYTFVKEGFYLCDIKKLFYFFFLAYFLFQAHSAVLYLTQLMGEEWVIKRVEWEQVTRMGSILLILFLIFEWETRVQYNIILFSLNDFPSPSSLSNLFVLLLHDVRERFSFWYILVSIRNCELPIIIENFRTGSQQDIPGRIFEEGRWCPLCRWIWFNWVSRHDSITYFISLKRFCL